MSLFSWIRSKRLSNISHPNTGSSAVYFLRNLDTYGEQGSYDYRRRVGLGTDSSVVMAPIQWIQRALPEAPLEVEVRQGEDWGVVPGHPLTELIESPNAFYSGLHLWQATLFSYCTDGNAYWIVINNRLGTPLELWWIPHWLIEPAYPGDGSRFITHYNYRVGGRMLEVPVEQVVHFRHGIDPVNPRKGISPIDSALREIWSDMEASEWIASLLRNGGVPGILITPDGDAVSLGPDEADEIKEYVKQRTTGAKRGEPLVLSGATKMTRLGYSPKELDLTPASDRSEERVCALLGVPSALVGFGSGLEQSRVGATMEVLRKSAWEQCIIPIQENFSGELKRSLLPLFRRTEDERPYWNRSRVAALQEDLNKKVQRLDRAVAGGWVTVEYAQRQIGIDPKPGTDVYLRRIATQEVPEGAMRNNDHTETPPVPPKGTKGAKETLTEERIVAEAERAEHTSAERAYFEQQQQSLGPLVMAFEGELVKFYVEQLAAKVGEAAAPIIAEQAKQSPEDTLIAERILAATNMRDIIGIYENVYGKHYLAVTDSTAEAIEAMGLATDIPDPVARAILATAGRRAGLVDLTAQTKQALFKALEEGRALGEGVDALVKRIKNIVSSGPWSSPEVRARVVARTETKFAQRVSTLHLGRTNGVEQYIIFDARLGDTDQTCMALDGVIVSYDEAQQLAWDEHPNGTRDYAPHFQL